MRKVLSGKNYFSSLAIACALLPAWNAAGQARVDQIAQVMELRVEKSLTEYASLMERIGSEKEPFLKQLGDAEDENIALRSKLQTMRAESRDGLNQLEKLKETLEELSAQTEYIGGILDEYLVNFESRIHLSEDQLYKQSLTRIREVSESSPSNALAYFEANLKAMQMGLERQGEVIGGYIFEGRAISANGMVVRGDVVALGPTAFFSADEEAGAAGYLRFRSGTIEPEVVDVGLSNAKSIRDLAGALEGEIPLDASLGSAIALEKASLSLGEHIKQGGAVGYFIIALGFAALALSAVKIVDMQRFSLSLPDNVGRIASVANQQGEEAGLAEAKNVTGIVGEMIRMGVRNAQDNAVLLEEVMLSVILKRRPEMERFLPFLAITAAAAPLLGLLGTVVGLIETFDLINIFGTGDPKALSSGISEALVTTQLGLVVAIPALVLHGLFSRMIKSRVGLMEQVAFDFVTAAKFSKQNGSSQ